MVVLPNVITIDSFYHILFIIILFGYKKMFHVCIPGKMSNERECY